MKQTWRYVWEKRANPLSYAFLVLLVMGQVLLVTRTLGDWWFEDDTPHLVFVRDHPRPLGYFMDRDLVQKLSLGHAVTPWFPFTFWLDRQLAPAGPGVTDPGVTDPGLVAPRRAYPGRAYPGRAYPGRAYPGRAYPGRAYLHTAVSLLLTVLVLFALLRRFLGRSHALAVVGLWLMLPSTVVITEFLSTRHYLEGLLFSLLAIGCAHHATADAKPRRAWIWLAAALYLLACTTKEVYVSATWFWLLWLYGVRRHYAAAGGIVACGAAYALYRFWALGAVGKNLDGSTIQHLPLFLGRMPYLLTGNVGGYLLVLGSLVILGFLWRRRRPRWGHLAFFTGSLGVLVVTLIPVIGPITHQYQALGTWYRVVFLLNTALLAGLGWITAKMARPGVSWAMGVLAALSIGWGGWETARRWDQTKAAYERDARFYLQHPERLLYSRLPAPWFLYGVHHLYRPDKSPHFITWRVDQATPKDYVLQQTESFDTIWHFENGDYRPDDGLLAIIRENCLNGITPLDRAPSPED